MLGAGFSMQKMSNATSIMAKAHLNGDLHAIYVDIN